VNEHLHGHHRIAIQHSWKGCCPPKGRTESGFAKYVPALNHARESASKSSEDVSKTSCDQTLRASKGGSVTKSVEMRIIY
jgi:hypothetical protein